MNTIINKTLIPGYYKLLFVIFSMGALVSCDYEYELPETGSIADKTPPSANFSASQSDTDFLTFNFANLSNSATDYMWDFGDGNTSTELDPSNTFPDEGTYTVSLTVSDKLGVTDTFTSEILVEEPPVPAAITPFIGEPGFEDGSEACGDGQDGRDCWRLSGASIHQITSSDGRGDTQAAKYPESTTNARQSYQAITVSPNTKYIFTAFYALTGDGDSVRVSIIDGQLSNFDEFESATLLAQESGTTNDGKGNFNTLIVEFETGANGEISMLFDSDNAETAYIDDVSIIPVVEEETEGEESEEEEEAEGDGTGEGTEG
ncbi:PKD domain-containing protein [Christiangramia forsetii]|uniref:Protein containing PKD domain n=2 Tax=Christiangramia forsetii TaxID=411153 RepID=A0M0I4_CHRFK|nr:PKD domain-containing protein [Christiangramia forsetii]CAL66129.1 protein containing PKD domain [Christiangramia forsetii KT0803]